MSGVALIYVRKSVVRHEEDRASPERQLTNCVRVWVNDELLKKKAWDY